MSQLLTKSLLESKQFTTTLMFQNRKTIEILFSKKLNRLKKTKLNPKCHIGCGSQCVLLLQSL